ncbi:hypothetical protein [Paenibacillus hexagrammi]|uniref:DUF2726 domain-containing protein n=1 Tax=Paenibacillus hexagrammi TaxID=2908839 RepID=A0ABY3SBV3_9BACL|nr:hypothetical protein [Paenibacillus sp. YPD9-1]UJF31247.1 hypothetical protein L0M14_15330 [Paenibacillus sp. YPD9-1]
MEKGDISVILLILIIVMGYMFIRFRSWLYTPRRRRFPLPESSAEVTQDEAVELLEGAGFDIVAGKAKVPITMIINDHEQLESRYFIDYFVQQDEEVYIVKLARERRPLEMTGSAVRDMLLPYSLIYPEAAGVLYVDLDQRRIKKIKFHIEV